MRILVINMEDNKPYIITQYKAPIKNSQPASNSDIHDQKIYIENHMLIEKHSNNEILKELNSIEKK